MARISTPKVSENPTFTDPRPETCPTCTGRRYCAPLRCYCGHEDCPAFASYIDMANVPLPKTPVTKPRRVTSWDSTLEDL